MSKNYFTKRQQKKLLGLVLTLITAGCAALAQHYGLIDKVSNKIEQTQPGMYRVTEFADGDTISVDMNGKNEKVRFIGVDTPETHDPRKAVQCFGKAASYFTKNLIGKNDIRLESDPINTNRDRYNRLLRYVYLPNGTLVNAEIIKQGYGFAYTGFPFTKSEEFLNYQTEAREQVRGLWKDCAPSQNQYGGYTSNDE